jgi:polyphosphate kinase 2 (PPK2 family)
LEHDYLWRHYLALPEKGSLVFYRSHYENVLVTRVHPEYIMYENLPGIEKWKILQQNFGKMDGQIRVLRNTLQNGIILLKFFTYKKGEQRERLLKLKKAQ